MLVRIVAFGQLPQALFMVFSGALRGVGDTRDVAGHVRRLSRRAAAVWPTLLAWSTVELHIGPLAIG